MSVRISGSSVRGNRHIQSDMPCQDAYAVAHSENVWGIAVADGLGSARHSDAGARIAVDTASRVIIADIGCHDIADEEWIKQAFFKAREAVINEAIKREIHPSEFASTLIVAFYSHERITIGHIGDGVVVGTKKGQSVLLSSPGDSEYANETASLMQSDWENQLRITPPIEIDHVIIATDGCQGALAIKRDGMYQPHEPFILPLLSFIEKKISVNQNPEPDFTTLLSSRKMQDLSGDDKTLVVIFREQISKTDS